MGRYIDFDRPSRNDWKFGYFGKDLLEPAKVKLASLTKQLDDAQRNVQAAVAASRNMRKDDEVDKWSKKVEKLGPLMEQCEVFVHEFERTPDREFQLALSDVAFFNLHGSTEEPLEDGTEDDF